MRLITLPIALCVALAAAAALGQNWGGPPGDEQDGKPEAGAATATKVPGVLPSGVSLAAVASSVMKKRVFFNLRTRRKLGITAWSVGSEVIAMHKTGELAGMSREDIGIAVTHRLAQKNPKVFAAEKAAWDAEYPQGDEDGYKSFIDRFIALIIRLLPLILMFL